MTNKEKYLQRIAGKKSNAIIEAEWRIKQRNMRFLEDPHTWNYPGGGTDTEEILQERWGSVGRPNFFYFVSPENLLKVDEIPDFAGLIYVSESEVKTIKKAPKLHSFRATDKLIRKVCNALSAKNIFGSDIKLE